MHAMRVVALLVLLAAAAPRGKARPDPDAPPSLYKQYLELEDDAADEDHKESHGVRPTRSTEADQQEQTSAHWRRAGLARLRQQIQQQPIRTRAKNVILFLGDGMSIPTLTAARIQLGGESSALSFERFPYSGLSKTYCVDSQVADSACSSTAYLSGVKANLGTIGVTAAVPRSDCKASLKPENQVNSILRWAQDASKRTGIVTTTRVTHASPSGTYAHAATRDWESDKDVRKDNVDPDECPDIARQLVTGDTGRNINVILGGGRREFRSSKVRDEEGEKGHRKDGRDLIAEWRQDKQGRANASYVWDRKGLLGVDANNTDFLLGLFDASHMEYHMVADPDTEPTLAEMVRSAVRVLSKDDNGFFLFVEGGKIDLAHHKTRARRALDETIEFSKAVKMAQELTSVQDTLIVVTADHAHTMSISGYPTRGNDILGIAGMSNVDKKPFTTINYANGPGYKRPTKSGGRYDLTDDNMESDKYAYPAVFPRETETHGGDDVAIFSLGPWAHLLTGSLEQNVIPYVMAYSACIGPQAAEGFCPDPDVAPAPAPALAPAPAPAPASASKRLRGTPSAPAPPSTATDATATGWAWSDQAGQDENLESTVADKGVSEPGADRRPANKVSSVAPAPGSTAEADSVTTEAGEAGEAGDKGQDKGSRRRLRPRSRGSRGN
ncbi:alkaline phosphatase-like [Thrips palmi]|uniref:alkaline phosphatase n=1 Tax=Thrips palmi TaxID=161013 RepID=A0A6P8ZNY3_THRPL|nr:alkaline phosphatase-like [Thrips palmi]